MREPKESETAYARRRFLEADDDDSLDLVDEELRNEGLSSDVVRPRKSDRRKELRKTKPSSAVVRHTGQLPAEQIVDGLPWPTSVDGEVDPAFVAGMRYEAMNVIRGIRMAQELNKMGLKQAKPVIEMAKEMRQAEGQAAQVIASQLGAVTMQNDQQILAAINHLAASQGGQAPAETNPMADVMAQTMKPILQQVMQQVLGGMFRMVPQPGGSAPAQQPAQEDQSQSNQSSGFGSLPSNITTHRLDELEEE